MKLTDYLRLAGSRQFLLFGTAWLAFAVYYFFKGEVGHAFVDGLFALAEYSVYYWLKGEENDSK